MKKPAAKMLPIELIVDIFIVMAVFVAMAAGFIIVVQSLNNNTARINDKYASDSQLLRLSDTYSQSPNVVR